MNKFNFFNPTQIVFGRDRFDELDTLVPKDAKVLLTYGGQSAKKFGTIDRVLKALKNRAVIEFGGIEANPKFETLVKATEVVKKEGVTFLLAVGGGSVMDGTKFIALASKISEDKFEGLLFNGFTPAPQDEALPLGCIATLPATGSEMNAGAVITYKNQKYPVMSPLTFPKFSLLDSDLTKTLPKEQVANGVADAFIHVMEQYLTYPSSAKIQDRFAEGILQTLIEDGPITYNDYENIEARENFIWSATMALNGIIGVGVPQDWSTHMIGHELTSMYGIAHGRTLAIVFPSMLRERKVQKKEKLLQYASRIWGINTGTEDERVELVIQKTEEFFNSLGIVTKLSHYDIKQEELDTVVSNMEKMGLTALSETGDLGLSEVKSILEQAY